MGKHYDLYESIGGGGFADVYRAVLRGTTRQFALKLLRDFRNPDARHRFAREVRMLRGLKHERVVKLIDANTNAEQPFYVMPLMSGGAMTAWAGRLPFTNVRVVLAQVLDFLVYLHAQGGLHRDIKPDNLLVDAKGNLAVGDFGLGNNPRYTVLMTAHAAGTWGYVAPELSEPNARATSAADIYSLGATMFHLVTGMHPKDATTLDPLWVRPDIPPDIRSWILAMVRPDPRQRPTASQLLVVVDPGRSRRQPKASTDAAAGVAALFALGAFALIAAAAS